LSVGLHQNVNLERIIPGPEFERLHERVRPIAKFRRQRLALFVGQFDDGRTHNIDNLLASERLGQRLDHGRKDACFGLAAQQNANFLSERVSGFGHCASWS